MDVARQLWVTEGAVEKHARHILTKLRRQSGGVCGTGLQPRRRTGSLYPSVTPIGVMRVRLWAAALPPPLNGFRTAVAGVRFRGGELLTLLSSCEGSAVLA
ncbi:hypothetical protein GCM10018954_036980 [Kutzneria kofuensis]